MIVDVADDGEILGLDHDRFENEDKLLLFLTNIIKSRIGILHIEYIHFHLERIQEKTILRVDVQPSNTPSFISDEKIEHLYIRTGPSTTDLRLSKVYEYIRCRFG